MNPFEKFTLFVKQQWWRRVHYDPVYTKPEISYAVMKRLFKELSEDQYTHFTEYLMDEGIISKFDGAIYFISKSYIQKLPEPNHFELQHRLL